MVANTKLIIVLVFNPSPIKILAHIANVKIPAENPNNLPGHINPSNAVKPILVAKI